MRISDLPKNFVPSDAESRWSGRWEELRTYESAAKVEAGKGFVIDTPPPTVSGSLHIGHVFSYTQTDLLARFERMRGKHVVYPIGWDDNGLPTERRVQNYFNVRCDPAAPHDPSLNPEALLKRDPKAPALHVSRENFIDLCLRLTAQDELVFKELWTRVGLSVDWKLQYSTMDRRSRYVAQASFLDLYKKGHIYSAETPTMWDIDYQTAVAQAELEDRSVAGHFYRIRFGVEGTGESFTIATTRPELLPACVGITAHPDDARYRSLFGRNAVTPLFQAPVPIFASELADPEKGTGVLMVCTFGDATDVRWWKEKRLPLRQIIGRNGRLAQIRFGEAGWPSLRPDSANRFYGELTGRNLKQARRAIVELLSKVDSEGPGEMPSLESEPQPIQHSVKFYEKGDQPVEFITTRQWFVRLIDKKERLLEFGDRVAWHPEFMRKRFRAWTENLGFDWAISRQRYFGVSFPVWYPLDGAGEIDFARPYLAPLDGLPIDPMTSTPPGYTEEQRDRPGGFTAERDVFDTWFTSSMSPQIVAGWLGDEDRFRRLFPMDLRPQAHDIIRTWAFYTIAKAMLHQNDVPWRNTAISGWILDPDRKKMSKSKGNVVTPMHLLDEYGSDAVRYWAANAQLGADTAFDLNVMKVGKRLVTKIFNASKFVLGHAAAPGPFVYGLDHIFLGRLAQVAAHATELMESYRHEAALGEIERFFWTNFTDSYIEMTRARAYGAQGPAAQGLAVAALRLSLNVLLRLFAPFLPFITEEVWSWQFAAETGHESIHRAPWPGPADFAGVPAAEDLGLFEVAVLGLNAINRSRSSAGVSTARAINTVVLAATPSLAGQMRRVLEDVRLAARSRAISITEDAQLGDQSVEVLSVEFAPSLGESV